MKFANAIGRYRQPSSGVAVTPTPSPTPTPAPSFTTQPSISPSNGTAGSTLFTASNGVASNATGYTHRYLLDGAQVAGNVASYTPVAAGSLVLEVTATGPGGSTIASSAGATVSAAAGAAGASATTFALAPTVQYHPNSQAGSVTKSGGRVTACPDLRGLAALNGFAADGTTVVGPAEMTDALGRKFWRFNGTADGATGGGPVYATIAQVLNSLSSRGYMVVMAGRVHHAGGTAALLNPRYATYTDDATNTAANSSIGLLRATSTSGSAQFLQGTTPSSSTGSGAYKAIPGAQMQVMALASRTTANGGQRAYINNDAVDYAQATTSVTGYSGAILGGTATGTNGVTSAVGNAFDLYELAIWRGELTNAQADAAVASVVGNFAIPQLDTQLLLEGDSITDGIPTALATNPSRSGAVGSALSAPGAGLIPGNVRVVSIGTSGSTTTGAVTRRDSTNAISQMLFPGGAAKNVMVVQLGRNDFSQSSGQKNSATFYADMVALLNTTTTGYLQRGWKCFVAANIAQTAQAVTTNLSPAGENTLQKRVEGFRALVAIEASHMPQPQFLTDTLSNSGQTFESLVNVLHLYDISQGGNKWFYDAVVSSDFANATPAGPYDSDATHLVAEGATLMANGGDTPQYGYGSVL